MSSCSNTLPARFRTLTPFRNTRSTCAAPTTLRRTLQVFRHCPHAARGQCSNFTVGTGFKAKEKPCLPPAGGVRRVQRQHPHRLRQIQCVRRPVAVPHAACTWPLRLPVCDEIQWPGFGCFCSLQSWHHVMYSAHTCCWYSVNCAALGKWNRGPTRVQLRWRWPTCPGEGFEERLADAGLGAGEQHPMVVPGLADRCMGHWI